ncbi:hypothetical protein [Sphingomonas koreensis]|uniref:hypothetical protein n=1 Tax=Sphingomonas koreensis TaxID=93064 RepID=UPI000F7DE9CA|nr:hypothetical protein [Sphingomonas koreensis]
MLMRILPQLDMDDFQPDRPEQDADQLAQLLLRVVRGVIEGAGFGAQLLPERLRRGIGVGTKASGKIAVHALQAELALPIFRRARAGIPQPPGARGHSFLEGIRKGGERVRIEPERLKPGMSEGEADRHPIGIVGIASQRLLIGLATDRRR